MPDEKGSGGSRLKTFFTTLPGILTGAAALVTAVAALAGLFLSRGEDEASGDRTTATTSAQNPGPQAKFLAPPPGRVARMTTVLFSYSNVDPDADLWLIERSGAYYPHPLCLEGEQPTVERLPDEQDGEWSDTIEIGGEGSAPGDKSELLVLLTSERQTQLLTEQIRGWCNENAVWPGIPALPKGSKVLDKVDVFR
jgi:hypothetical protein